MSFIMNECSVQQQQCSTLKNLSNLKCFALFITVRLGTQQQRPHMKLQLKSSCVVTVNTIAGPSHLPELKISDISASER